MELTKVLGNHKSIRKYKNKEVDNTLIEKIVELGIKGTSSSGNMQTFSIIITKDYELRKQLYPLHFNQEMVLEAPVLMTFCADFNRMRLWLKESKAEDNFDNFMSFMIASIDATLVSQSIALAAENEGLGICYMGTTLANCKKISEVLKLPKNVLPIVGYSLGYPDETPTNRDRLATKALIHYDTYQDYSKDDIENIYHERETAGWERYMANKDLKNLVEKSKVENLAQIYTSLKYTKESHLEYSKTVLDCIKEQDFFNN